MLSERGKTLIALLSFDDSIENLSLKLSEYDWDCSADEVTLTSSHAIKILNRFLSGELAASQIEAWANLIECREDIGFEKDFYDEIKDLIFELANPLLTQSLTTDRASYWIRRLTMPRFQK